MADGKEAKDDEKESLPPITGDFATWSQAHLIDYFLELNDPSKPLYEKDDLAELHIDQLRAWATKAFKIRTAFEMQGKIEPQQKWIPAAEGQVPMPLGQEVKHILKERAKLTRMEALLAKDNQDAQGHGDQQQPQQRVQFQENNDNGNHNNDNGNGNNNNPNAGGGFPPQQRRKKGVKRSFEDCYAPMPQDEKYEEVSPEEAARFFNGGFAAIKSDVDALLGVEFFKIKNGNGQVFYMKKDRNGNEKIKKLHQKRRPTGFDTDDDVDDDGFQDELSRDPFFRYNRRDSGAPPKKRPKVSIGHMMQFMFDDEEGTFSFGARAMARGDVERKILDYCKKNKLPFDVAYQKMWKEKKFTTSLGTPFDLSIEENRDLQLKRSYLTSIKLDSQYSDLKEKFTTLLDVENGKELDSKRKDVEFSSGSQLLIAFQCSLRTFFEYFKFDMNQEDREKFLVQSQTIMLMAQLDLQRYPKQLQFIQNRLKALVTWIFTPGNGRTKVTNVNGKVVFRYDKQLLSKYDELVRGYLNHNAYSLSNVDSEFVVPDLCIAWNLGVNCTYGENCKNLKKWHEFFSHHCFKHGRQAMHLSNNHPSHPLVTCTKFRATWRPVPPPTTSNENSIYERPDMRKALAAKSTVTYPYGPYRGRGNYRGRGRGGRGRCRGRGRGGFNRRDWNDNYPTGPKPTGTGKPTAPKIEPTAESSK